MFQTTEHITSQLSLVSHQLLVAIALIYGATLMANGVVVDFLSRLLSHHNADSRPLFVKSKSYNASLLSVTQFRVVGLCASILVAVAIV